MKSKYAELRKYFNDVNWKKELVGTDVHSHASKVCDINVSSVSNFIPLQKGKYKKEGGDLL